MLARHELLADGQLFGISYQNWTWAFGLVGLITVVLGAIVGVRQLKSIARQSKFTGTVEFQRLTREHEGLVQRVLDTFPIVQDIAELNAVSLGLLQEARLIVNSLNDTGQLVEAGLIDKRMFFGLYHTQVIRIVFVLRPFLAWEESRIGGRYGRRLLRLDSRAKRYHDTRAIHRLTTIKITRPTGPIDIYTCRRRRGLSALAFSVRCRARWIFGLY